MEPGSSSIFTQLGLIALLTLLNAFFASAEMAFVAMNQHRMTKLAEDGDGRAKLLLSLSDEPTRFLSTIQVGITLAGFFSSASAATGLSDDFGRFLARFGIPSSQTIALVLITLVLSYFILVFGELYPKRLALTNPESIALFSVRPILLVMKVAAPFVKLLSLSTNLLLRISGIDPAGRDEIVSREEIRAMLALGQSQGAIDELEREMLDSIFEFDDKVAEEIMVPRTEVFMIDMAQPLEQYLSAMLESKHSKIPVYSETSDNITGILYIKDFFDAAYRDDFDRVDIASILRPPLLVSERMPIDKLFRQMQKQRESIAILIDEHGGFNGIVTLEDLIEEIMGEIEDLYDPDDLDVEAQVDGSFLIKGQTTIRDLNKALGTNFDETTKDYYTIAGLLMDLIGYVPDDNARPTIETEQGLFDVLEIEKHRIVKVRFRQHD